MTSRNWRFVRENAATWWIEPWLPWIRSYCVTSQVFFSCHLVSHFICIAWRHAAHDSIFFTCRTGQVKADETILSIFIFSFFFLKGEMFQEYVYCFGILLMMIVDVRGKIVFSWKGIQVRERWLGNINWSAAACRHNGQKHVWVVISAYRWLRRIVNARIKRGRLSPPLNFTFWQIGNTQKALCSDLQGYLCITCL